MHALTTARASQAAIRIGLLAAWALIGPSLQARAQGPSRIDRLDRAPAQQAPSAARPGARFSALDPTSHGLREQQFPLGEGIRIVAVFHPACGFCKQAARDIQTHAELLEVFRACSVWLAEWEQALDLQGLRAWQRGFPAVPVGVTREWEAFGLEEPQQFPVLHIYRNGQRLQELVGWPGQAHLNALAAILQREGARADCTLAPN